MFVFKLAHDDFRRRKVFLFIIAGFAAGDAVALVAFSAAHDGQDVIHRQLFGRERFSAIVANALGQLLLPPIAFAQFLGPCALPLHMGRILLNVYPVVLHTASPFTVCKLAAGSMRINEKLSI